MHIHSLRILTHGNTHLLLRHTGLLLHHWLLRHTWLLLHLHGLLLDHAGLLLHHYWLLHLHGWSNHAWLLHLHHSRLLLLHWHHAWLLHLHRLLLHRHHTGLLLHHLGRLLPHLLSSTWILLRRWLHGSGVLTNLVPLIKHLSLILNRLLWLGTCRLWN